MKKIIQAVLCVGLISSSIQAKECKLLFEPADFQLDKELKAPNESQIFSVVGNAWYREFMEASTKTTLCLGLIGDVRDQHSINLIKSCQQDIDKFFPAGDISTDSLMDMTAKNAIYGFRSTSKNVPITQKQLCSIQKKYINTKKSSSQDIRFLLLKNNLQNTQEEIRQNYLKASQIAGQSISADEISETLLKVQTSSLK